MRLGRQRRDKCVGGVPDRGVPASAVDRRNICLFKWLGVPQMYVFPILRFLPLWFGVIPLLDTPAIIYTYHTYMRTEYHFLSLSGNKTGSRNFRLTQPCRKHRERYIRAYGGPRTVVLRTRILSLDNFIME